MGPGDQILIALAMQAAMDRRSDHSAVAGNKNNRIFWQKLGGRIVIRGLRHQLMFILIQCGYMFEILPADTNDPARPL